MHPKEYIEKHYKKDLKRFRWGVICRASLWDFCNKLDIKEWPLLDHFLVCQYELNLLSQVIYSYFKEDHDKWLKVTLPHNDCRCFSHNIGFPLFILEFAEQEMKEKGHKFKISGELIKNYDKYFINYVSKVCEENDFISLTQEKLVEAVRNDGDCNREDVARYLMKKLKQ